MRFEYVDVVEVLLCEFDNGGSPTIPEQLQLAPLDCICVRVYCRHRFSLAQIFPLGVLYKFLRKEDLLLPNSLQLDGRSRVVDEILLTVDSA